MRQAKFQATFSIKLGGLANQKEDDMALVSGLEIQA